MGSPQGDGGHAERADLQSDCLFVTKFWPIARRAIGYGMPATPAHGVSRNPYNYDFVLHLGSS